MTELTIGQRIAERRKLLNLSQEALGEKMGVSRQAISKWEADGAIPEIDKLIAMSKLFSVSVGWLLGTEPEAAVPEQKDAFTDEQLMMVEEIVKRYQQPAPKTRDWVPAAVAGMLLVVVAVGFVGLLFWDYVNRFAGDVSRQFYDVNGNYIKIQDQLEGLTDRLDELAKGEKLLEAYTVEGTAWDDMAGATVRFSGTPKYTVAGETAWLSVRWNDEEVAKAQCTTDGVIYTAEVELPAADGYTYYFQVTYEEGGGAQQILTEAADSCVNLTQGLQGHITAEGKNFGLTYEPSLEFNIDKWVLTRHAPEFLGEDQILQWQQIDLIMYYNDVEWDRVSLLEKFGLPPEPSFWGEVTEIDPDICYVIWTGPLPELEEGDRIRIKLEYRHLGTDTVTRTELELIWENESEGFTRVYQTTFG